MEQITGTLERIIFQGEESGFTVALLQEKQKKDPTCIVGNLPMVQAGELLRCEGKWKMHLVHGKQFEVQECTSEAPADVVGIRKYLGSGLIHGIGPKYAERIVDAFGDQTLNIIDKEPKRLLEVEGIGRGRLKKIISCWKEQKTIRDVMIFLQGHGVSPAFAQRIFKTYGSTSIQKVKDNPYALARDINGIGFLSADKIASALGIEHNSPKRIDAGCEFALTSLTDDGHVCYPVDGFLATAAEMLQVESKEVESRLDTLAREGRITLDNLADIAFIWLKPLYIAEKGIAEQVARLQKNKCFIRDVDTEKALEWVQKRLHINLAEEQETAVADALIHKTQVITGGPGTGKSTITRAILAITEKLTKKVLLAAPTGRAAKRMAEITRHRASTIHSLLEWDFQKGGFKRNTQSPLDCDLLIVDEASMIDTLLMYHLLRAVPNHARLILIGDINQLPSVGPGNVLKDMIASEEIAVNNLTKIFRQAKGSHIVTNAHKINEGEFPYLGNEARSDFFFIDKAEPHDILKTIVSLTKERIPKKYSFNPFDDIQVLAPMKKGVIGTHNLNHVMQDSLNPKGEPLFFGGGQFRVGDKVMQIRNNYQKEVFNGDVGKIIRINTADHELTINYDDREVLYDFGDLDEVVLAYAVSIHKYQGSECPCIVIPLHTTHFKLLYRNLLYTGVTRGKKLVILVGTKKALALAIHNDEVKNRYTGLKQAMINH